MEHNVGEYVKHANGREFTAVVTGIAGPELRTVRLLPQGYELIEVDVRHLTRVTAHELRVPVALPPKELHPNAGKRHNIHKINRLFQEARQLAWAQCKARLFAMHKRTGGGNAPRSKMVLYRMEFRFKTNRRRDEDNLVAWTKSHRDGFEAADLVFNDSCFKLQKLTTVHDKDAAYEHVLYHFTILML